MPAAGCGRWLRRLCCVPSGSGPAVERSRTSLSGHADAEGPLSGAFNLGVAGHVDPLLGRSSPQ